MVEVNGLWEAGKALIQVVIVPVIGFAFYYFKKNEARMDVLEKDVSEVKTAAKVLDERVNNLKDDIKEIKEGIKELLKKG